MERNDRLKLFANEIGDIKDTKLKTLATELIANADVPKAKIKKR